MFWSFFLNRITYLTYIAVLHPFLCQSDAKWISFLQCCCPAFLQHVLPIVYFYLPPLYCVRHRVRWARRSSFKRSSLAQCVQKLQEPLGPFTPFEYAVDVSSLFVQWYCLFLQIALFSWPNLGRKTTFLLEILELFENFSEYRKLSAEILNLLKPWWILLVVCELLVRSKNSSWSSQSTVLPLSAVE